MPCLRCNTQGMTALCFAHCAGLCFMPAPNLCCFPARTHRAGQAGRDAVPSLSQTRQDTAAGTSGRNLRRGVHLVPHCINAAHIDLWHVCMAWLIYKSARMASLCCTAHTARRGVSVVTRTRHDEALVTCHECVATHKPPLRPPPQQLVGTRGASAEKPGRLECRACSGTRRSLRPSEGSFLQRRDWIRNTQQ